MSTLAISCQKFNAAEELKTLSRGVLSVDAQRMLGVLDCAIKKILVILGLGKIPAETEELSKDVAEFMQTYLKMSERYSLLETTVNRISNIASEEANSVEENREKSEDAEAGDETTEKQDSEKCEKPAPQENSPSMDNIEDMKKEMTQLRDDIVQVVRQLLRTVKNVPYFDRLTEAHLTVQPRSSSTLPDLNLPLSVSNFPEACSQAHLSNALPRPHSHLMRYFLQLRGVVFSNMLSTPEDQKRKKKYVKEITGRLNEHQTKVDSLTKEMETIVAKNKSHIQATGEKVSALQQEIRNLENYLSDRSQRIKKEEEDKSQIIEEKYKSDQRENEKKLAELKENYRKQVEENREIEKRERVNIFKIEMEIEARLKAYDQEMTSLKEEYDTLDEEYTREKEELNELEERFQTLEEEYQQIMEERRLEEERLRREQEERKALEQAVCTIQAYWRSYKTRKMARGKRGGAGKGRK